MTEMMKKRKISDECVQADERKSEFVQGNGDSIEKPNLIRRPRRYTFEQKHKILSELKHLSAIKICFKYDLNESVLYRWKMKRDVIEKAATKNSTKKLKKVPKTYQLEAELFKWFNDCLNRGIPVSRIMIRKQALVFNSEIGGSPNFKASRGWLARWEKRTQVRNFLITREELPTDEEAANRDKVESAKLVAANKIEGAQISNVDESPLMDERTPKKTFVPADHTQASGRKKQLDMVTIVTCCNADGFYMLPLILLGKSKNLQCIRNINKNKLSVW